MSREAEAQFQGHRLPDVYQAAARMASGGNIAGKQPSLVTQLETLDKLLSSAHSNFCRVESAVDRVIGQNPAKDGTARPVEAPYSLQGRIADLIETAQALLARIQTAADRLDSAV